MVTVFLNGSRLSASEMSDPASRTVGFDSDKWVSDDSGYLRIIGADELPIAEFARGEWSYVRKMESA